MTRSEFIRWLEGVEGDFPVTEWRVRGIRVWPLVRLSLYSSTFQSGSPTHGLGAHWPRRTWNLAASLAAWARTYLRDWPANRAPTTAADAVFLTYSAGRRPLIEGKRYDPMAGPCVDLLGRLGQRSLVWEISPFGDYNVPRYTPSFLLQPTLMRLRMQCEIAPLGEDHVELAEFGEFLARVRATGLRFPHAHLTRLRRDALYLRRLAAQYTMWLRAVRPRLGFVTDTGLAQQAFCLACRELDITSVEIQHGVQGDLHPSYGSWFAVPKSGYETRARVFWSRDRESALAINRWAARSAGGHVAVWGGDPWREMWMEDAHELVRRTDAVIVARKQEAPGARHILVTLSSQGDVIPPSVLEIIRRPPATWHFWLRLHPADQRRRHAEVRRLLGPGGPGLDLLDFATEAPLPALLRHMDAHVTVGLSTVVMQAAAAGVPSVACAREAADFYRAELATGMLVVATTEPEVREGLRRLLADRRRPAAPEAPRALTTMQRLLRSEFGNLAPVAPAGR